MLSFANKAGLVVSGFAKVMNALDPTHFGPYRGADSGPRRARRMGRESLPAAAGVPI